MLPFLRTESLFIPFWGQPPYFQFYGNGKIINGFSFNFVLSKLSYAYAKVVALTNSVKQN